MILLKKTFLIICSLTLLLFNVGCSDKKINSNASVKDKTVAGSSGPIIEKQDWLYISGKIQKVKTDGTQKNYIGNGYGDIIDAVDGWIYYISGSAGSPGAKGIYKTNGEKTVELTNDDYILQAVFYRGSIYYALGGRVGKDNIVKSGLFKIDSNGKNKIKITDQMVNYINIYDNWIYYSGVSFTVKDLGACEENNGIFRIKTDGSCKTEIYNKQGSYLRLSNGNIYFHNQDDNGRLYKIDTNGKNKKKLNDDNDSCDIIVSGNWVYYTVDPWNGHTCLTSPIPQTMGNIYKISTDGNERTKLSSDNARLCEILDGWLYYSDWSNGKFYKIKPDGSNKSLAEIST